MNNAQPRRAHINVWNGTTNLSFKDTKVILSADQVDMFTDMRNFESEGSTYIVNGSGVESSRGASRVSQASDRPMHEGRARTGSYGKLKLWVFLCRANCFSGYVHNDPHPNPPPPVVGYGRHHSGTYPTQPPTGMPLRPQPNYRYQV